MVNNTYPVVLLAGGKTPEKILMDGEKEEERAFIEIGGKPMVVWVIEALKECKYCKPIFCIGNPVRLMETAGLISEEVTADTGSLLGNFILGVEHFREHQKVLIVTCDIPLITSSILTDLLNQVETIDAEIYYPIIDVKYFDAKFKGARRTTQYLKEGVFTGGNIFVVMPEVVLRNRARIEAVIRDRKSPAKLIKLFGLPFILKFAMRKLDLAGLEAKASEILCAKMRGVRTSHPEVGFDVDKPEDLALARSIFGKR